MVKTHLQGGYCIQSPPLHTYKHCLRKSFPKELANSGDVFQSLAIDRRVNVSPWGTPTASKTLKKGMRAVMEAFWLHGNFLCLTCNLLSKYKNAVSDTKVYMCVSHPISYFFNTAKFGSDWECKPVGISESLSRLPESSLVQVCVCMTHAGRDLQVHSTGSHVERRAFPSVPTILGPHHPIHKSKSCSNPQPPTLILLPLWHLESLQLWSPMPGIPGLLKVLLGIVSSDGNTRTQPSSHSYYRIPIAHWTTLLRTPLLRTEGLPPCHLSSLCSLIIKIYSQRLWQRWDQEPQPWQ